MKSYYERTRDEDVSLIFTRNGDHTYPAHFHTNLEIFLLKKGRYLLTLNGEAHEMREGDIVVIDSFDVHAYQQLSGEDDAVLIFPLSHLRVFDKRRLGKRISNPFLRDAALCERLLSLADSYLGKQNSEEVRTAGGRLLLSILFEHLHFTEDKRADERATVQKILAYLQEHFRERIGRGDIARALGYTEAHISRVFHRYLGKSLPEYLNGLRLQYVERLRREGDERPISTLAFEAGFGSEQTYYRAKRALTG